MNIFSISNPVFVSPENQSKIEFKKIENNHPIFEGLFKKTSEDIKQIYELPQINMYWKILPEVNSHPLIILSDNSVFLSESNVQKGKLIFCSVSANNDMSKFPLTGLFPSILIRSLQYLAGDINENLDFPIGQTNILASNGLKKLDYYINPENKKIPFAVDFEKPADEKKLTKNYFSFPYTSNSGIPGFYTFFDSASGRNSIAALNPDPNESNLDVIDVKEITNYFEKFGFKSIKYIDKPENLKNEIKSLRNGLELWKYFLLLAILLIIIEIFYSRRIEKS